MAFADTWLALTGSGSRTWADLCISSDGTKLAGVTGVSSYVWVSTDSGATWAQKASLGTSRSRIVCSDDFGIILANTNPSSSSQLIRSTDYGENWASVGGSAAWGGLCISGDGQIAYACYGSSGRIYKSTDSGANWSLLSGSPAKEYQQLACSSDGSIVYATVYGATQSYKSVDGGINWTQIPTLASLEGVTCSSDGQIVIVGTRSGSYYYVSNDAGASWTTFDKSSAPIPIWNIGCSSNGQYIIIGGNSAKCYASIDSGATWSDIEIVAASTDLALGVCVSSDATKSYVSPDSDYIYQNVFTPFTISSITPSTGSTAGGTPVTIIGTGFNPAATAAIDGNDLTGLTVVNDTTITGITPAGTVGAKDVVVTNP